MYAWGKLVGNAVDPQKCLDKVDARDGIQGDCIHLRYLGLLWDGLSSSSGHSRHAGVHKGDIDKVIL